LCCKAQKIKSSNTKTEEIILNQVVVFFFACLLEEKILNKVRPQILEDNRRDSPSGYSHPVKIILGLCTVTQLTHTVCATFVSVQCAWSTYVICALCIITCIMFNVQHFIYDFHTENVFASKRKILHKSENFYIEVKNFVST